MTSQVQIKCDLCNSPLKDNEVVVPTSIINIGTSKPKAKSHLTFKFDGSIKDGDLCFSCARQFRDYIESKKEQSK